VLRGGRRIATEATRDCSASMLAKRMVGHEMELKRPAMHARPAANARPAADARPAQRAAAAAGPVAPPLLRLRDIVVTDPVGRALLDRVCIDLHDGEILGIAGVAGNGQRELCQILTGVRRARSGSIALDGEEFSGRGAREFAAFGVGHIPEDRLRSGLAPALSITDNTVMREYGRAPVSCGAWYRAARALALARAIAKAAAVEIPNFAMPAANLSGGNQQRLLARREMRIATKVLIAAYPNRGLDVGAGDTLMRHLIGLRDAGVGVVLISEELEELLGLADRIAVLCRGAIMGVVETRTALREEIGLMMAGQRGAARTAAPHEAAAATLEHRS
jgi:simple sugar transport system ATP-binding protein